MDHTTPLYTALLRHAAKAPSSFHTPGHKGHAGLLRELGPLTLDLTELPDTGSLYDGDDVIEQAERAAAAVFGARLTLFSAGGCTLCLQTMLYLGAGPNTDIVMARNAHVRAVDACALLGITPHWAYVEDDRQITPQAIAAALAQTPTARAVYITSPDYYGRTADIAAIAALCREHGVLLLVDNAHGSHLDAFDRHPLQLGAAMTADSAHKTLPVLTGGALLHIGEHPSLASVDRTAAKAAMALFGSTSPSFPVLASLDRACDWWSRVGRQAFVQTAEVVKLLKRTAQELKLSVIDDTDTDPTRFTLNTADSGILGTDAAAYFRDQGCEPELADSQRVVFILTPFNTPDDLARLEQALHGLPTAERRGRFWRRRAPETITLTHPVIDRSPHDAIRAPWQTLPTTQAVGRIAARTVCPCPPGIPIVVAGEVIDETVVAALEYVGKHEIVVIQA